ncbi:MAG: type II toxin-antitoxin system RelE/ParE family toxin [Deltaproteobacteria bacterium]|nr:type II toxin-antitoxin system RelE/ParE family toxin [Deltaproteobacteria bacterium]
MRKIMFYRLKTGKSPVEAFLDSLTNKQFEKIAFVLDLIEQIDIVPRKYFKKLKGTDGIWEVRAQHGNNIFRILGFFDGKDLVVLNHAFTKKSQKKKKKEITVAEKRKFDYLRKKGLK